MFRHTSRLVGRGCRSMDRSAQRKARAALTTSTTSGGDQNRGGFDTTGWGHLAGGLVAGAAAASIIVGIAQKKPAYADTKKSIESARHVTAVSSGDLQKGVYDITEFYKLHPGGPDKILMSAGDAVDLYWQMYMQHMTEEVMEVLEDLRIGTLNAEDAANKFKKAAAADDVYANEPVRHPALIETSAKPYNAETPPSLLTDYLHTPNALFFVRNHLPVPKTDEATHSVTVCPTGAKPITLSVADLRRKFPLVTVNAAIQCAGNRRKQMQEMKSGIKGLSWNFTAISNAQWTGVRLADVLKAAGIKPDDPKIKHIHFEGADKDTTGQCYGASIPVHKAFSPETILAVEMNGEPIPIDHGYPLRVVVPE